MEAAFETIKFGERTPSPGIWTAWNVDTRRHSRRMRSSGISRMSRRPCSGFGTRQLSRGSSDGRRSRSSASRLRRTSLARSSRSRVQHARGREIEPRREEQSHDLIGTSFFRDGMWIANGPVRRTSFTTGPCPVDSPPVEQPSPAVYGNNFIRLTRRRLAAPRFDKCGRSNEMYGGEHGSAGGP